MFDADGRVTLCNEQIARMTGVPYAVSHGQWLSSCSNCEGLRVTFQTIPKKFFGRILADMRLGKSAMRIMHTLKGRSIRVIEEPMTGGGWVATLEDITAWREAQEKLAYLAHHDPLTSLPNPTKFREDLEQTLRRVNRDGRVACFALTSIISRKANGSLGHPIGDDLLKDVAGRLRTSVPRAIQWQGLAETSLQSCRLALTFRASKSSSLAERLVEIVGAPYAVQGHQLNIGVSIGIAFAPNDGEDSDQLLKNADMALIPRQGGRPRHLSFLRTRHGCQGASSALAGDRPPRCAHAQRI